MFYQIFKEQLSNQIDVKMSIFTVDFENSAMPTRRHYN
jgi:hypothetical protein